MTTAIRTYCDLCQATGVPVRHGLVAWRDWQAIGHRYEDVDRCTDVEACRARVAANGEEWPVEDPAGSSWTDPKG
jgi:hypothetical protein